MNIALASRSRAKMVSSNVLTVSGYFVTTGAAGGGDGSENNPWTLNEALTRGQITTGATTVVPTHGANVTARVIWIHGGDYSLGGAAVAVTTYGTVTNPVILRQYPGEVATIDGRLNLTGVPDLWLWGFELIYSGSSSTDVMGIDMLSARIRVINVIAHEHAGNNIGFWVNCPDGVVYGGLSYHAGRRTTGFGHNLYLQSDGGQTHHIEDFTSFHATDVSCFAMHAYGSAEASLLNVTVKNSLFILGGISAGNLWHWGTGAASLMGNCTLDGVMVWSGAPNGEPDGNVSCGPDNAAEIPGRITVQNCYGRVDLWASHRYQDVTMLDNTFIRVNGAGGIKLTEHGTGLNPAWNVDRNTYYDKSEAFNVPFIFSDAAAPNDNIDFTAWQALGSNIDPNGSLVRNTNGEPTVNKVFVFPNKYEPKDHALGTKALIVIFNWTEAANVSVDLSTVLSVGQNVNIHHIYEYADRVTTNGLVVTNYGGGTVSIPMNAVAPVAPIGGWPSGAPPTYGPKFGAFVLERNP